MEAPLGSPNVVKSCYPLERWHCVGQLGWKPETPTTLLSQLNTQHTHSPEEKNDWGEGVFLTAPQLLVYIYRAKTVSCWLDFLFCEQATGPSF